MAEVNVLGIDIDSGSGTFGQYIRLQSGDTLVDADGNNLITTPSYYYGQASGTSASPVGRLVFTNTTQSSGITHNASSGLFTVTAAGRYVVIPQVTITGSSVTATVSVAAPGGVGGTVRGRSQIQSTSGTQTLSQTPAVLLNLSASATFDVLYNTAGSPTLQTASTHITVFKIAD